VAQALVRYLINQWSERDGQKHRLIAGCLGIFGHGNVAGIGEALLGAGDDLRYHQGRNEQAMVHTAVGYARMRNRLATMACTTSIGPGATNLVTGAALATINRLPVLLLPGDIFATRPANPVLQELEDPRSLDVSVNDALRPVSVYWDRINRPEQLSSALHAAMRTLTDPADTGAVTLALPQDVQAEAHDWPDELFEERVWTIRRPAGDPEAVRAATQVIDQARRPLIIAGGGVIYADATDELRTFAEKTGIPVAETQAGKGSLPHDHPQSVGAIGVTGTTAANALARQADVIIGIGTRYSDFTTASRSLFGHARFVNVNITGFDAGKLNGLPVVGDARRVLTAFAATLADWSVTDAYREESSALAADWNEAVSAAFARHHEPLPSQPEIIGAVNDAAGPRDVVVCAAGSMPGELHKLWRSSDPKSYHVEYGYSCMGYEIPGGMGVKLAAPDREVFVMVGDGSYLMMPGELVSAVAEGVKLIIVLVDNAGYASIGSLSESVGSGGFGTQYRRRNSETGQLDGDMLPVDLAVNAESLGAHVIRARTIEEFRDALAAAKTAERTTVVYVQTDPTVGAPDSQAWWDVPVAEVSEIPATREARARYEDAAKRRPRFP
jgi:3D-(3,5/4)-trihydroxycyclohexane-1,2-dione acylhydrolase (decyclizing)